MKFNALIYFLIFLLPLLSCKTKTNNRRINPVSYDNEKYDNISAFKQKTFPQDTLIIQSIVNNFKEVSPDVRKFIIGLFHPHLSIDGKLIPDTLIQQNKSQLVTYCYSCEDSETLILLLVNDAHKLLDFKKYELKYLIIPEGGYVDYQSNVKYFKDSVKILKHLQASFLAPIDNVPKTKRIGKFFKSFVIENNQIKDIKEITLLDSLFIEDTELVKLRKLTKEQLRIVRNYYFANLDYKFKDEKLITFFEDNLDSYRPLYDNVDNKLNPLDKKIINYINSLEKTK